MTLHRASASDSNYKKKSETEATVDRLRSLMLGTEANEALSKLTEKNDIERVSDVISEALKQRSQRDDSLGQALSPLVDNAIDSSIKSHPERVTNIIFPIIGPSIRKAVAAALQDMVQTLNQLLSAGLSLRSWRWRLEALISGKSYAEIVLLKTLQYRVEQVLLIHRETGLLLLDVSNNALTKEDPELVSAMLTAINDFVHDAFHKQQELYVDKIRFGEFTLNIVAGPHCFLVGAIKGTPAPEITTKLSQTIEQIHLDFASLLVQFEGDRAPFHTVDHLLADCLLEKKTQQKAPFPWLAISLLSLIAVGLCGWGVYQYQLHDRRQQVIEKLSTHGIVPIHQIIEGHRWRLSTLRSENTPAPSELINKIDTQPWQIEWDDRVIPNPPPPTTVPEPPSQQQIAQQQWQDAVTEIQTTRLHFEPASTLLNANEQTKLAHIIRQARTLATVAPEAGISTYQLVITGFADSSGNDARNLKLSKARATNIAQHLTENGIAGEKIRLWGLGALDVSTLSQLEQRVVSIQVFYQPKIANGVTQ